MREERGTIGTGDTVKCEEPIGGGGTHYFYGRIEATDRRRGRAVIKDVDGRARQVGIGNIVSKTVDPAYAPGICERTRKPNGGGHE